MSLGSLTLLLVSWTYVKGLKVCTYKCQVSDMILTKTQKKILYLKKSVEKQPVSLSSLIVTHVSSWREFDRLWHIVAVRSKKINLVVNQFLICVSEKLGLCFKVLWNYSPARMWLDGHNAFHCLCGSNSPNRASRIILYVVGEGLWSLTLQPINCEGFPSVQSFRYIKRIITGPWPGSSAG